MLVRPPFWGLSNPQKKDLLVCEKRRKPAKLVVRFWRFFATEGSGSRVFTRGFFYANPHKCSVCGASKTPVSVLRTETGEVAEKKICANFAAGEPPGRSRFFQPQSLPIAKPLCGFRKKSVSLT
jgi:hypothetical protein